MSISIFGTIQAQVGIDKNNNLGKSALLEFGPQARGIRLSPIENVGNMSNAIAGTIIFDGKSGSFLYKDSTGWSTPKSGGATGGHITTSDNNSKGVIIGDVKSSAPGILILGKDSGETKALVLPNVGSPEFKMLNPPAGLIVYDSDANLVKVWNGNTWTNF
ncbi:hypothetical protein IQ37_13035 [Chryseobacterium piperi]|uniref:Uncharacterized protein n=2 Tax=Chryseobacterium piperi TaxID=558152 RepID=A0A086B6Z0_9FLAO|nr:hypothetical protein CJF12_19415 [Chryseobacterium piperi]KFF24704.1 hypothetical protein IQ37_13035 [Chryseobacterium piperi]